MDCPDDNGDHVPYERVQWEDPLTDHTGTHPRSAGQEPERGIHAGWSAGIP